MIEQLLNYNQNITPILFEGEYVWMRQSIATVFNYEPGTIGIILKNVPNSQLPQLGTKNREFANIISEIFGIEINKNMLNRIARYKLITVTGMKHLIKHASRDTRLKEIIMPIVKHIQDYDPGILQEADEAVVVKCDTLSREVSTFENAMASFKDTCISEIIHLKKVLSEKEKEVEKLKNIVAQAKRQINAVNTQFDLLEMAA